VASGFRSAVVSGLFSFCCVAPGSSSFCCGFCFRFGVACVHDLTSGAAADERKSEPTQQNENQEPQQNGDQKPQQNENGAEATTERE
jgi:hypothetical protein